MTETPWIRDLAAELMYEQDRARDPYADVPHTADVITGPFPPEDDSTLVRRYTVDLAPFLDGTFVAPTPSVGALLNDGSALLYPGKWHTVIAPTTSGKSWLAAQCVYDELCAGRNVVYVHYEETLPAGTVERLLNMGLDKRAISEQLTWLATDVPLTDSVTRRLADNLEPALVVLDGINAACSAYGWEVNDTKAVGAYRQTLVMPWTARNAAVLSLGHPPKAKDRQSERHGFGSTAWLDEVDGVGFRLIGSTTKPISRGKVGYSRLYTVKDRYGQVESLGERSDKHEGWYDLGSMQVANDDLVDPRAVKIRLLPPSKTPGQAAEAQDKYDRIADALHRFMTSSLPHFQTLRALREKFRAAGTCPFSNDDLPVALERLVTRGVVEWPEVPERQQRPGWLADYDDPMAGPDQGAA